MEFDELKKGFWGYRREDVIRYVEEQEAEMAKQLERRDAKLAEKDSQLEEKESHLVQLETKYEDRISDLEKELVELRRAQRQAERLREESIRKEKEAQEALEAAIRRQKAELDMYSAKIGEMRQSLREMLCAIDGKAQEAERLLGSAKDAAPVPAPVAAASQDKTPKRAKKGKVQRSAKGADAAASGNAPKEPQSQPVSSEQPSKRPDLVLQESDTWKKLLSM